MEKEPVRDKHRQRHHDPHQGEVVGARLQHAVEMRSLGSPAPRVHTLSRSEIGKAHHRVRAASDVQGVAQTAGLSGPAVRVGNELLTIRLRYASAGLGALNFWRSASSATACEGQLAPIQSSVPNSQYQKRLRR